MSAPEPSPTSYQFPTCYRHPDQRAGVVCQRCDRPICPHCMNTASVGFHCPECSKTGKQKVYNARSLSTMGGTVTKVLIGINVAVYILGVILTPSNLSVGFGGNLGRLDIDGGLIGDALLRNGQAIGVANGEWWRIITGGFLHSGLLHLGFNMFALWVLGQLLERVMGPWAFGAVYGTSLVAGSFGALLVTPMNQFTVGASGAIFGLMGAALVAQKAGAIQMAAGGLMPWVVLNLLITFVVPGISIGGHLGGLVGGAVAGAVIFLGPRYTRNRQVPIAAVAALGVVLFVGCIVVAGARASGTF